ncbi:hypothetical protein ACFQ78_19565 [Streptomyces sp. NPDC056519]|uniref:hypothetical protein n=1 Tax=Streptomyces sp. NPDC056519 TaxID=3345849 RepID=UPI003690BB0A
MAQVLLGSEAPAAGGGDWFSDTLTELAGCPPAPPLPQAPPAAAAPASGSSTAG